MLTDVALPAKAFRNLYEPVILASASVSNSVWIITRKSLTTPGAGTPNWRMAYDHLSHIKISGEISSLYIRANSLAAFDASQCRAFQHLIDNILTGNYYAPRGAGPYPALIALHGGFWKRGTAEGPTAWNR